MKFKNLFKIILCLMLSCSLCVSAPLARYQRIESHAAVAEVVVLGAATLALMYLASSGINYIFNGMDSTSARSFMDVKLYEYQSEVSEPPPITDFKITKLGKVVLGIRLATWFSGFANWVIGEGTETEIGDNEVVNISTGGSVISLSDRVVPSLDYLSDSQLVSVPVQDASIVNYCLTPDDFVTSMENIIYNQNPLVAFYWDGYSAGKKRIYLRNPNGIVNLGGLGATSYDGVAWNEKINKFVRITIGPDSNGDLQILWNAPFTLTGYSASDVVTSDDVFIKTGVKDIPSVAEGEGVEIDNPSGVNTITVGADAVPVPVSDATLWANLIDQVLSNTATDVVYNPTYDIVANYGDIVNVNSTTYDIPLTSEEEDIIAGVTQPAWADVRAGDVPAFATDVWNYFMQNHNWNQLKQKFPFSLPYDAYLIANIFFDTSYDVMDELPTASGGNRRLMKSSSAPVYRLEVPLWDNRTYELVLDFSIIDDWVPLIRAGIGVLFTVGLIVGVL